MEGLGGIGRLPEECVSHVLSFTSPRDSCRSALVSTAFRCAADSDTTWSQFLPSDYQQVVARAVDSPAFGSLKELYFLLCDSVLIDGGRKIFALEKESGAKCYTLCARDLGIAWGDDQRYWRWRSYPDSRFAKVAELLNVWWLEISGKLDCRELSPNTSYKAYLIFKLARNSCGLNSPAQHVSVTVGDQISEGRVCLQPGDAESGLDTPPDLRAPRARSHGWMEMEMGEFFNEDGGDGEVSMSLKQVKNMSWKRGLIIEGIQVRPK